MLRPCSNAALMGGLAGVARCHGHTLSLASWRPPNELNPSLQPPALHRYKVLEPFTKEDARSQFLRILRTLPYGSATFFAVKRIEDPIGLLPAKLILGINKRGVHFFRPVPKEYLHSAELRDIMQVGEGGCGTGCCLWQRPVDVVQGARLRRPWAGVAPAVPCWRTSCCGA
jgi:hypothetical protein